MSDLLTELQNERTLRDTRLMQTLDRAQDDITSKRYKNPLSREFWNLKREIGDVFKRDSEVTLSLDDFNALRNLKEAENFRRSQEKVQDLTAHITVLMILSIISMLKMLLSMGTAELF